MGVWPTPWAEACLLEGNRFWFYSLVFSIVWTCLQLYRSLSVKGGTKRKEPGKSLCESTAIAYMGSAGESEKF